ncbi:hypothetical protein DFS33DRAFT_1387388 [Desarmillaria ectypa]|nr:hypothetical protein DFS33DRAFT_1387388 [Desarmillaria ectypa]
MLIVYRPDRPFNNGEGTSSDTQELGKGSTLTTKKQRHHYCRILFVFLKVADNGIHDRCSSDSATPTTAVVMLPMPLQTVNPHTISRDLAFTHAIVSGPTRASLDGRCSFSDSRHDALAIDGILNAILDFDGRNQIPNCDFLDCELRSNPSFLYRHHTGQSAHEISTNQHSPSTMISTLELQFALHRVTENIYQKQVMEGERKTEVFKMKTKKSWVPRRIGKFAARHCQGEEETTLMSFKASVFEDIRGRTLFAEARRRYGWSQKAW